MKIKFINIFFLAKVFVVFLIINSNGIAKESSFFDKGIEFFNKKDYEKSKLEFEKDIVFDPKSEKSYLYLAKIFYERENEEQQEINLNNVLLLNPQNDEAIYMLTILKIGQSDYDRAKELIEKFSMVCKTFCSKKDEMREKFDKLIPENEKNND
tara:strand:- start:3274 stop:3735 length:462 start_codon:yes stop_codon:yes gene_type:complete